MGSFAPAQGVLQGIVEGLKLRQQKQRDQASMQEAQDRHDLLQKQIDEIAKQHQAEHDIHQQEMDLHVALAKRELQNQLNQQYGNTQSTPIQSLPQATPNQSPLGGLPGQEPSQKLFQAGPEQGYTPDLQRLFGQINIDPQYQQRQMDLARQQNEIAAEGAGQKAKAETEAKFPSELAIEQERSKSKYLDQYLSNQGRLAAEQLRGQYSLGAAKIRAGAQQMDPDDLASTQDNVETGQQSLKDLPARAKIQILNGMGKSKTQPVTPDEFKQVQGIQALDPLFDRMNEMKQMLPKGITGATAQGAATTGLSHLGEIIGKATSGAKQSALNTIGITTDLQNKANEIKAMAPIVVRNAFGVNGSRINMMEVNNGIDAMTKPGLTQDQAQQNIDNIKSLVVKKQIDATIGNLGFDQRVRVLEKAFGDPDQILDRLSSVKVNVKGKQVPYAVRFKDGKIGLLDEKVGQYGVIN